MCPYFGAAPLTMRWGRGLRFCKRNQSRKRLRGRRKRKRWEIPWPWSWMADWHPPYRLPLPPTRPPALRQDLLIPSNWRFYLELSCFYPGSQRPKSVTQHLVRPYSQVPAWCVSRGKNTASAALVMHQPSVLCGCGDVKEGVFLTLKVKLRKKQKGLNPCFYLFLKHLPCNFRKLEGTVFI